jgi:hypothetical protein
MRSEYFKEGLDNAALHAIQEMAELTKALTKALMYGWGQHSPWKRPQDHNYLDVFKEMEDVNLSCKRLVDAMAKEGEDKLKADIR